MYSQDPQTYPQWIKDCVGAALKGGVATVEFPTIGAAESGRARAYAYIMALHQGPDISDRGVRIRRSGMRLEIGPRFAASSDIKYNIAAATPRQVQTPTNSEQPGISPDDQAMIDRYGLKVKTLNIGDVTYWTITNDNVTGDYQYKVTLAEAIATYLGERRLLDTIGVGNIIPLSDKPKGDNA